MQKLAAFNPHVASYVVPNAFNRRVLLTFNLRSADHLINLRTAENAHYAIRRAAYRIAEQIQEVTPLLGNYLRITPGETWQSIEEKIFSVGAHSIQCFVGRHAPERTVPPSFLKQPSSSVAIT